MIAPSLQTHCPFCHAAQVVAPGGHTTCEYCLQPFSVGDVAHREALLLAEIQRWLGQKLSPLGLAPGGVDTQSRAYLFAHKILPELQRDIDRATERLAGYAQIPLLLPPMRIGYAGPVNPLSARRPEILLCQVLHARLSSADVLAFATREADRAALGQLEGRLAELFYLSNTTEAGGRGDKAGYAAAHKNLRALEEELCARPLADEIFLRALVLRYQALGELCGICETLYDPLSADRGAQVERVAGRLESAARQIEASGYSPADAMPLAIGVKDEALACHALSRWLGACQAITGCGSWSFVDFVRAIEPFLGGLEVSSLDSVETVEALGSVTSAARGRTRVPVVDDFSWVSSFIDGVRGRKTLGLFGQDEEIKDIDEFWVPVWIADVAYSRRAGAVFREGVEGQGIALVESCAPRAEKVAFMGSVESIAQARAEPRPLESRSVALPQSTRKAAAEAFAERLSGHPDLGNATVRIDGLVYLPAVAVSLESQRGLRQVCSCLGGLVPVDQTVWLQKQATKTLLVRFAEQT